MAATNQSVISNSSFIDKIINKEEIESIDNTSALLTKGIPVYNISEGLDTGEIVKTYPDGRQDIVCLGEKYEEVFIRHVKADHECYFS